MKSRKLHFLSYTSLKEGFLCIFFLFFFSICFQLDHPVFCLAFFFFLNFEITIGVYFGIIFDMC